jgi:hypothetical protein
MEYHVREGYRTVPEGNLSAGIFLSSRIVMRSYVASEPATNQPSSTIVIRRIFTAAGVQIRMERVADICKGWSCALSKHELTCISDLREVREVREVRFTRDTSTRLRLRVR